MDSDVNYNRSIYWIQKLKNIYFGGKEMNIKKIVVLTGLVTMGMVSFAMGNSDAEVLKTKEEKGSRIFNINDRVRFDENRLEINGNLHFNENNRLEMAKTLQ